VIFSCKKEEKNHVVIFPDNETIEIKSLNWFLHGNNDSILYIELGDYSKIQNNNIVSMNIKLEDSLYTAEGVSLFREKSPKAETKFLFMYDIFKYNGSTKKIVVENFNNKQMIGFFTNGNKIFRLSKKLKINVIEE
jgi:hypothetical protein